MPNVEDYVDHIEGLLQQARPTMGNASMVKVDKEEILNSLTMIKETLPIELKNARETLRRSEEIIALGQREAQKILQDAQTRAAQMTSEHAITEAAKDRAREIEQETKLKVSNMINEARKEAGDIRNAAERYRGTEIQRTAEFIDGIIAGAGNNLDAIREAAARQQDALDSFERIWQEKKAKVSKLQGMSSDND